MHCKLAFYLLIVDFCYCQLYERSFVIVECKIFVKRNQLSHTCAWRSSIDRATYVYQSLFAADVSAFLSSTE